MTALPPTTMPPTTMPAAVTGPHAAVAHLAGITDPRRRLSETAALIPVYETEADTLRPLRHALIFKGMDRFFGAQRRCLATNQRTGLPCAKDHYGLGLCANHLRRYRKGAVTWQQLGLVEPPENHAGDGKFKKLALDLSGISHWNWLETVASRRYPLPEDAGWTDAAAEADPGRRGYWRVHDTRGTVTELDEAPDYPDAATHWRATGDVHAQIVANETRVRALQTLRRDALHELFPHEGSNRTLAELAGMKENSVYKERVRWRNRLAAAS